MDFETGTLDGWKEVKGSGGPDAYVINVVSEPGPNGNANKAVKITNNLNQGYTDFQMNDQLLLLKAGASYRLTLSAKTTASNAGASIPKMTAYVWLKERPLPIILPFQNNGVAIGNGWYKFTFAFQMPLDKGGDSYVFFDFQRNASPTSTFLDDISISSL
jgi:hypothetical protein